MSLMECTTLKSVHHVVDSLPHGVAVTMLKVDTTSTTFTCEGLYWTMLRKWVFKSMWLLCCVMTFTYLPKTDQVIAMIINWWLVWWFMFLQALAWWLFLDGQCGCRSNTQTVTVYSLLLDGQYLVCLKHHQHTMIMFHWGPDLQNVTNARRHTETFTNCWWVVTDINIHQRQQFVQHDK